jgi:hypothetical protein
MMRARARASATREVSIVIQRRPHCSATVAVVPEPQVGSRTRSPGSVAMRRQRSTFASAKPLTAVSAQWSAIGETEKSSRYRFCRSEFPTAMSRCALTRIGSLAVIVFQCLSTRPPTPGQKVFPWKSKGSDALALGPVEVRLSCKKSLQPSGLLRASSRSCGFNGRICVRSGLSTHAPEISPKSSSALAL